MWTSEYTLFALVVSKHSMIFPSYSLQITVKSNRLWKIWPQMNGLRKKYCAFWASFRKKEESFYFFPNPVIFINNEPSLNWKCFGLYVTRELIWRQTPNLCITVHWNKNILLLSWSTTKTKGNLICIINNSHRNYTNRIF